MIGAKRQWKPLPSHVARLTNDPQVARMLLKNEVRLETTRQSG